MARSRRESVEPPFQTTLLYVYVLSWDLTLRGCTLDGYHFFELFKDRKSVILGVWAAPGGPETLAKGGGRSPPPFGRVSGPPRPPNPPKWPMPTLKKIKFPPQVQPRLLTRTSVGKSGLWILGLVGFGPCSGQTWPQDPLNGSGSKNDAERKKKQPWGPILITLRNIF